MWMCDSYSSIRTAVGIETSVSEGWETWMICGRTVETDSKFSCSCSLPSRETTGTTLDLGVPGTFT